MGAAVLVLGPSGSGKSTSLRNFPSDKVGVFNVLGKPLPFRGKLPTVNFPDYNAIKASLARNKYKCYVIDDSTYLMQNENFRLATVNGYQKFTSMAVNFQQLIMSAISTSEDTVVYFLHHIDTAEDGRERPKTIGKMLDSQFCIEGAFPIVLDCAIEDGKHIFKTQSDGMTLAKSPMGMLPPVMDNDLYEVDKLIRDYWEWPQLVTEEKEGTKNA